MEIPGGSYALLNKPNSKGLMCIYLRYFIFFRLLLPFISISIVIIFMKICVETLITIE